MRAKHWVVGVAIVVLSGSAGCIDNPSYRSLLMWPPAWQQWREWREDEQYAATLYQKLDAIHALRHMADDLSDEDRRVWAATLNRIITQDSVTVLRSEAVEATQYLPLELVEEGLRQAQKDPSTSVRIAACHAWGVRSEPKAVEALATILGSETDLDVQLAAAKALGRFKDPRAVAALGRALESKDPALQRRAARSLASAAGADWGTDIAAWQRYLRGEASPTRQGNGTLVGLPLPRPFR